MLDTDISITSHSGAFDGVWTALGVPYRYLQTGELNMLVVRVIRTDRLLM